MKTRFSSLVALKKNTLEKSERAVQEANKNLHSAQEALQKAYSLLENIDTPSSGNISHLLSSRTLLESQRGVITHNQEWLHYCQEQLELVKSQLKRDMIEYEKYKYLDYEEQKKALKEIAIAESKELDEIASITFNRK